jgi:hypothetical protein
VSRRTSIRRGPFVMLEILLVVVLAFGMLARCGSSGETGEAPENVPANPEEAGEALSSRKPSPVVVNFRRSFWPTVRL